MKLSFVTFFLEIRVQRRSGAELRVTALNSTPVIYFTRPTPIRVTHRFFSATAIVQVHAIKWSLNG